MTESMEIAKGDLVIGPPALSALMKLRVAITAVWTAMVMTAVFVGVPVYLVGLVLPIHLWIDLRKWRRIRVTAWNRRLVVCNWKGPFSLDRDTIRAFEIARPSGAARREEDHSRWSHLLWKGPMLHSVCREGQRVPLFATFRMEDTKLRTTLASLESWLHPSDTRP